MHKNQEMSYEDKQFFTPPKPGKPKWMRNVYLTPPLPATPPPSPACWQSPKYIAQYQSSAVPSPSSSYWHTYYSLQRQNTPISSPIQAYQHVPQNTLQPNITQMLPTSPSYQHAHYIQQQSTPASPAIPSYQQALQYTQCESTQMPPLSSSYWSAPKYYYHYEDTPVLPTSPGYRYGYAPPYPLQCQSTPVIPADLPVEPAPEVNTLITPVSSVQDLDKIIRDFETGYSSPRKKDNDSPVGTGKFVKKMVAAIEHKFIPSASKSFPETKTRHNNSKSDSKNSSNQKSFNGTFVHDSSVKSAEKFNLNNQESMQTDFGYNSSSKRAGTLPSVYKHQESMQTDFSYNDSSKSAGTLSPIRKHQESMQTNFSYNDSPKSAGTLSPIRKHQESMQTNFNYNDSPKSAGTLSPIRKHQESMQTNFSYNDSPKRAGTLSPVRKHQKSMQTNFSYNDSTKRAGTLSPVRKHQKSMQTNFSYNDSSKRAGTVSPIRKHQESMQTDFSYNDTVKSTEKLSPISKYQSMQVDSGHNDTLIIDDDSNFDMEEEADCKYKTQPIQQTVSAEVHIEPKVVLRKKREVTPKPPVRSESFDQIKVAPKIVAAKLKKPIEVDTDTEIEWIPVKNQKLPRKNSFKKLLSLLIGKKKHPNGNKFFCNLNKSNEEKKSSRDSGYVEKSSSSSSVSSHGSSKNYSSSQQIQENIKFPRRNSGLSTFQQSTEDHFEKWIGHPLEDNTSEKSVIITQEMINKKDRMILNEIDRSEVRTSLGPFYPLPSKTIFTDIKKKLRENSAKTNSSKISKEFINSSLMSSFSNKSPVGSPQQKRSSLCADRESESGNSYKSLDLFNPALQLPSWKFPSDEIVYDHPKNNWSQSEPFIFEASQNYNQQFKVPAYDESEYDVPKSHMHARPKSSIYEDALSVKRRTESLRSRPESPNFYVSQKNEEMHFATIKPRPRVLSNQQILRSMADDESYQLRSPYLVRNLCL